MLAASRANTSNPYGSSTWNNSGGNWTNTQTLSPEQQKLYQADTSSQIQLASLLNGMGTKVGDSLSQPFMTSGSGITPLTSSVPTSSLTQPTFANGLTSSQFQTPTFANGITAGDFSGLQGGLQSQIAKSLAGINGANPSAFNQSASDAAYNNQTRYLLPQQEKDLSHAQAQLAQQGFVPGTPAYNQAMTQIQNQQQATLANARDTATLEGAQIGSTNYNNLLRGMGLGADVANTGATTGGNLLNSAFGQKLGTAGIQQQQNTDVNNLLNTGFGQQMSMANAQRAQQMDANQVAQQLFGQRMGNATLGNQTSQQQIANLLLQRQTPINELNSLRSGTQVTNPGLTTNFSTPNLATPDQISAANQGFQNNLGIYNANVGSNNSMLGSLGGLAGNLFGGGGGGMMSGLGGWLGGLFGGAGAAGAAGGVLEGAGAADLLPLMALLA